MKRFKALASILVLFVVLSSFGVVENNKYVKAKVEQEATLGTDFNRNLFVEHFSIIEPNVTEVEDEPRVSLAQKVGDFIVGFVKKSFSMAVKFLVNLIK